MRTLFLFLAAAGIAHAATITDPSLGTEIDPTGSEEVDTTASGATAQATLEALTDIHVLQDWSGFSAGSDIVAFPDSTRPDIRITTSFSSLYSDSRDTGANMQTSSGGQNFAWSGTNGQTLTIEFGDWDGSTFTPGTGVKAAGLTFVNFGGAYNTASDQTITYYDASDAALSTQTFAGAADTSGGSEAYSGHLAAGYDIAKIVISITRNSGSSDIAIDDLAFTEVAPQPGSLQFTSSAYSGPYNGGSVSISVERVGGTAGTVSVDYATGDGSALDGIDYTATSATLTWTDGQSGTQSFAVSLLNNPASAGTDFSAGLSNATGGASIGSPSSATVSITAPVGEGFGTDLAAYMTLDESSNPGDHSEYRLGATSEGTVSSATAVYGNARSFDGSGDRLRLDPWTDETGLPDREALTVSLWFKADTTSGDRVLFDDPAKHDALGARISNGNLQVTCLRDGKKVTLSTAFTDTTGWHNLAVVKNADSLEVFLDDSSIASVADLDAASASSTDAGTGSSFDGLIDEVRLYRRALSTAEITALQVAPALSPSDVWRGYYFARTGNTGNAADAFDYDLDGSANILERAFATSPVDGASRFLPSQSIVPDGGNDYLALSYRRLQGGSGTAGVDYSADGITYTVEYDVDLDAPWNTGSVVQIGPAVDNGDRTESVIVRLPDPLTGAAVQFLRLNAAGAP